MKDLYLLEIHTEIFTDEVLVNSISIYKTNVYSLYFVRKEQFGLRDEDALSMADCMWSAFKETDI